MRGVSTGAAYAVRVGRPGVLQASFTRRPGILAPPSRHRAYGQPMDIVCPLIGLGILALMGLYRAGLERLR